jgi:NTP pyrophosphatase (non-canonical NTP hydrolase)
MKRRDLDFKQLRKTNVRRCVRVFQQPLNDWTLLEWAGALCGEAGEAANVAKKIRRLTTSGKVKAWHRGRSAELLEALADEVADVVIYADLLLAAAGADLGEAVRRKFNKTSVERGTRVRL